MDAFAGHSQNTTNELSDWLCLARAPGLGSVLITRLIEALGEPAAIIRAPDAILSELKVPERARRWLADPDWLAIEADLRWLDAPDHHLLTLNSPDYPELLRQIPDPPVLLFLLGRAGLLTMPQLAIVGSRNPTTVGVETATDFAAYLARRGLLVCSGLASGIDAAAHRGALAAVGDQSEGATIAVVGTGLDRVYPARHRDLAHAIAGNGLLVSELPPGTAPRPHHFPRRNRIISGLSLGTLVVEAGVKSGSLITAQQALEQGREVFAIPGSIHNPMARGCHVLLRQGAKLVESGQDIIDELGGLAGFLGTTLSSAPEPAGGTGSGSDLPDDGLDSEQLAVLDVMGFAPIAVDTIVQRSGLTAEVVSSILLILELQGFVSAQSGGYYMRSAAGSDDKGLK